MFWLPAARAMVESLTPSIWVVGLPARDAFILALCAAYALVGGFSTRWSLEALCPGRFCSLA